MIFTIIFYFIGVYFYDKDLKQKKESHSLYLSGGLVIGLIIDILIFSL